MGRKLIPISAGHLYLELNREYAIRCSRNYKQLALCLGYWLENGKMDDLLDSNGPDLPSITSLLKQIAIRYNNEVMQFDPNPGFLVDLSLIPTLLNQLRWTVGDSYFKKITTEDLCHLIQQEKTEVINWHYVDMAHVDENGWVTIPDNEKPFFDTFIEEISRNKYRVVIQGDRFKSLEKSKSFEWLLEHLREVFQATISQIKDPRSFEMDLSKNVKCVSDLLKMTLNYCDNDYLLAYYDQILNGHLSCPNLLDNLEYYCTVDSPYPTIHTEAARVQFPNPLVPTFLQFRTSLDQRTKLELLLDTTERVIAFLGIAAISAEKIHSLRAELNGLGVEKCLKDASMGAWLHLIREVLSSPVKYPFKKQLKILLDSNVLFCLSRLRNLRNELSHPQRVIPRGLAAQYVDEFTPDLEMIMFALGFLFSEWELVHFVSQGSGMRQKWLTGLDIYNESVVLTTGIDQGCFLANKKETIPLDPLLIFEECSECHLEETFLWNGYYETPTGKFVKYVSGITSHRKKSQHSYRQLIENGFI